MAQMKIPIIIQIKIITLTYKVNYNHPFGVAYIRHCLPGQVIWIRLSIVVQYLFFPKLQWILEIPMSTEY